VRREGRARGTREVKAEDVQVNDSHRRVAQWEILRNQDWGDTWLWTYGIYTEASVTGNSHSKTGGPIAKGEHIDEDETGEHKGEKGSGQHATHAALYESIQQWDTEKGERSTCGVGENQRLELN
jgi:hypothetical protein